jgi:hypothetical protein
MGSHYGSGKGINHPVLCGPSAPGPRTITDGASLSTGYGTLPKVALSKQAKPLNK